MSISQQLPHLNFPIVKGHVFFNMFILVDKVHGLNLVHLYYHQSLAEHHPNLVVNITYLKVLEDVNAFKISGVGGGK